MRKLIISALFLTFGFTALAQISVVGNNKPLGFLNPALQNYELNKGVVSASGLINPLVEDTIPLGYLIAAEYKINDDLRIGVNASQTQNRLGLSNSTMLYGSYRLELETGNYLMLGMDMGAFIDEVNSSEFNKVFAPNRFAFGNDSNNIGRSSGFDWGIGLAYSYNGLIVGLDFSKLNKPAVFPFPLSIYDQSGRDSTFVLADTAVVVQKRNSGLESNLNVIYEWRASKHVELMHSLHISNVDLAGFDYIGFQNIAKINNRHSIGLGGYYNGNPGFILTGGYGFSENLKLEVTSFVAEEFNYNTDFKGYASNGYKPSFEFNLRFEF